MTEHLPELFKVLKRQKPVFKHQPEIEHVFFQLQFNTNGAFIQITDNNGKSINPSYEYYNGSTREVLRIIQDIQQKNSFQIDWERPNDEIYLGEHYSLLWSLIHCDNFVDKSFDPIQFEEGDASLELIIVDQASGGLECSLVIAHKGKRIKNLSLLNEKYVISKHTIYRLHMPIENFRFINLFHAIIGKTELEKYLSLFFSYFEDIKVKYNDYQIITGTITPTLPTIVIEEVTPEKALHLSVTSSLKGFDPLFFESYDIRRIAQVNDMERKIRNIEIQYHNVHENISSIDKLLKKHRRDLKNTANFIMHDNLFIIDENIASAFIYKDLPELMIQYQVLGSEKLKENYKVKAVRPQLDLSLSHGIDFLEGDVNLQIEGQTIPLFEALSLYHKNAYIPLNDGTHGIINHEYIDRLKRLFKKTQKKVKISFFDLPIIEEMIDENIAKHAFKRSRDIFMGFNTLVNTRPQYPKLNATLRSYQKQGYKWLKYLHQHQLGGCLADDMGLGKTIQTITLLASIYPKEKRSSLIVMPRSLLFNWENEIKRFRPELSCSIYHGTARDLSISIKNHVILTTYAILRNDIKTFQKEKFYYIVLDESQNIKNMESKISKAVMLLLAEHRLALSGTPIENNLGELYALFRFLNPSMFGSLQEFNRHYITPIQKNNDKEATRELKKKIYPFILRRLKKDVVKELPPKIEQTLYVDMRDDHRLFYENRRIFYYETIKSQIEINGIRKSQFLILQALNELRQIASVPESKSDPIILSPKREILMQHLSDVLANNHKALIFANYLAALYGIAEELEKEDIQFSLMTGATRNREQLIEAFQENDENKIFLLTLKTGGIGLNLTAADYIFLFDPWWNRAVENQAIDRSHRIGQNKTVFAYRLITRGTIEEKILRLQEKKGELFDNLISSDGASIKTLDETDVEFVLGE